MAASSAANGSSGRTGNSLLTFLDRRGVDLARNVSALALVYALYVGVRLLTADQFSNAMANAANVLQFQSELGFPSELKIQAGVLERTHLLKSANIYYIAVHFPATVAFLGWVWLKHRSHFNRMRNTLIGATAVGLVLHVTYPLAPPRMLDGFVDTAAWLGPNPYDMGVSDGANQIAAMPSHHVGWALVVALGLMWILKSRWRLLSLVHPVITAGVVIVTANHYWADIFVAVALVIVAWVVTTPGSPQVETDEPALSSS